jgi:integrative and conjugative element protein (TIGR02256 family)
LVLRLNPGDQIDTPEFREAVKEDPGVVRDVARGAEVQAFRVHHLSKPKLELRNANTLPGGLSDKTAVLFGVGAIGGDVAESLAKAGVGHLILVDSEEVRLGNVIRHISGIPSTGLRKVDAVRHSLWQHNPFLEVVAVPHRIGSDLDRLEGLLKDADLAIAAVADENVEMVINDAAIRMEKTVVYGRSLRGGAVARVFRVRPGVDACKMCLAQYRASQGEEPNAAEIKWIDLPPVQGEIVERECGRPVLAGSAVDLRFASDLTARAAIDELGVGQVWNHLIWSRDPLPDVSPALAEPYTVIRQLFPPRETCSVCRIPQTEKIVVSTAAHADIVGHSESKRDVETGGILIGFRDKKGSVQILEVTAAGPNAIEERTRFERDYEYCQKCIDDAAARLGTKGQYVGEWHSHHESDPQPSARDVESLTGIAQAANYLTNEPVMLIAGLDPASGKVKRMHGSCFPLGMRCIERELVLEDDSAPVG